MKVLLLSDIYKQGVAGEVVDVSDGYARNYLIPKRLAAKATPNELKKAEKLRETAAARKAELEGRLNDLARQIDGVELVFGRRAANTGKLFGSVTTSDIAELLHNQTGIDINRRRISQQALREIGSFDIPVRLGTEISPNLKVIVVREDELQSFLAKRKAALEAGAPAPEVETAVAEAEVAVAEVEAAAPEVEPEAEQAAPEFTPETPAE